MFGFKKRNKPLAWLTMIVVMLVAGNVLAQVVSGDLVPSGKILISGLNPAGFKLMPPTFTLKAEGVDPDGSVRYLQLANGAPLLARQMANADDSAVRDQRLEQLQAIFAGQLDPVQTAKDWVGESEQQTLEWWRVWLQALVRWQLAGQQPPEADVAQKLRQIVETVDCRQLFDISDQLTNALNATGSGLNRQMVLEDILISWAKLANQTSTRAAAGNR